MNRTAIIELHFLPSIAWFSILTKYDICQIESHESYKKGSYRNRCHILGPNGLQRLTIPLKKGKNQNSIQKVEIAYDMKWQKHNWQSIQTAYGKSPFYEYYVDEIKAAFFKPTLFLFEFNMNLVTTIIELLDIECKFSFNTSFQKEYPKHIDDFRNIITPKTKIPMQTIKYEQVFEDKFGFVSNLSILDLLFCKGPESILILNEMGK